MKQKIIATVLLASFSCAPVFAADDPISARKTIMQSVGAATKAGAAIAKGEAAFNAVTAELVLRTMNVASLGFGELFPEGSETGGKTTASPKIWEDRAGFAQATAKFQSDTAAGIAAKPADIEAFRAAFGAATANCGACHKAYRVKKE